MGNDKMTNDVIYVISTGAQNYMTQFVEEMPGLWEEYTKWNSTSEFVHTGEFNGSREDMIELIESWDERIVTEEEWEWMLIK